MNSESKLGRSLPKWITLKRRRSAEDGTSRNNKGIGPTGVVVTIVILAILAGIGGPPLWRLIRDAREHAVNTTLQEAAQVVQNRLTLQPELADSTKLQELENALIEDFDVDWNIDGHGGATYAFSSTVGDERSIHVQFIKEGTSAVAASGTAPTVDWLLADDKGVRIQAQNSDGAWACALIVLRPNVDADEAIDNDRFIQVTQPAGSDKDNARVKINAWLGGIWYDSEETPLDSNGLHACSPALTIGSSGTTVGAALPTSASEWPVGNPGSAGSGTGAVTAETAVRTLRNAL